MRVTGKAVLRTRAYALINELNESGGPTDRALHRAGEAIQATARLMAPEDTGALIASITVTSAYSDDYMRNLLNASRLRPEESVFAGHKPREHGVCYIYPLMRYALFVEVGSRKNRAQPYLIPATRMINKILPKEFSAVINWGGWRHKPMRRIVL